MMRVPYFLLFHFVFRPYSSKLRSSACVQSKQKKLHISVYSNRHFLSSMNNGYVIRLMTSDVRSYIIIFVSFYIITFFSPFLMIWFLAFFTPKLHRVFFQGGRNLGNLA